MEEKKFCACVGEYGNQGESYGMSSGCFEVTWHLIHQEENEYHYAPDVCGKCFGSGFVEET